MKRKHVAVFTLLANGHVYPALPLCAELARRGHRVTFVTNDHYAPAALGVGSEPVVFRNKSMSEDIAEDVRLGFSLPMDDPRAKRMMKSWRLHSFSSATDLLAQVSQFYERNVPDLILYDRYHLPGRILANRLRVPVAQISPHFAYYNGMAFRGNGVCQNPPAMVEASDQVDSFLSTHGITTGGSCWHVESLNIHFIPREFQYHSDWFDEHFCFSGALLNRPFLPVWTDGSNGRPVILISGPSLWNDTKLEFGGYFGLLVEALSGLPCYCILSIGDDAFSGALPSNFELNRRASHLEILPHTALLICHGGMGSTLEAIYNGVPVLMIPMTEFCEEVAYRAEELGLGVRLPRDVSSIADIRNTVSNMLQDASIRHRVKCTQEVFRRSGGEEFAADRVESYVADCGV